ncbi:MAG: hypothetical protein ACW98F_20150 [Candidatus Hodarchaeales archaeon]
MTVIDPQLLEVYHEKITLLNTLQFFWYECYSSSVLSYIGFLIIFFIFDTSVDKPYSTVASYVNLMIPRCLI